MDNKYAIFAISAASTWNGSGRVTSDELQEAKMLAYKALEKQIPMIPLGKTRTTWNDYVKYTDYYCPVCGKQQKRNYSTKRIDDGWHCERCGQKLRWRTSKKSVLQFCKQRTQKRITLS